MNARLTSSRCVVAAFLLLSTTALAQQSADFDAPVHAFKLPRQLPECGLEAVLLTLAKDTGVRIGFERTTACNGRQAVGFPDAYKPLKLANAEVLDGLPLRDVLARIAALTPDYDWAIMDGVAVFRPSESWKDAKSPLRASVPPIHLSEVPASRVISTILNLPGGGKGPTAIVSIDFQGGTMLDALNALVRSQALMWYASPGDEKLYVSVMEPRGRGFTVVRPLPQLSAR